MKRILQKAPALRGLSVAIALAMAANAHALRLSDIEIGSYLDQPLKARVQIRGASADALASLVTTLASREAFERAGIQRADALANMTFDVDPNGRYLYIQTDQPVREPFMLFLVRGDWNDGSLTREYALLLDLPTAASAAKFDLPNFGLADTVKPFAKPDKPIATKPAVVKAADVVEQALSNTREVVVKSGDTLGRIARRYFDPTFAADVGAFTQALFELNPSAFINGNINLIRAGAELRLPSLPAPNTPTLVADQADVELPGVALETSASGGLRLVTQNTLVEDTETEYLRQRIQTLELQLAQLQANNASRTEVGNLIAEATGTALTPLPVATPNPAASAMVADDVDVADDLVTAALPIAPVAPLAPLAPVAVAPSAPATPIASITKASPAAAAPAANTIKTIAVLAQDNLTNPWAQSGLGALLTALLGWFAWGRRSKTRFVPAAELAEPAPVFEEAPAQPMAATPRPPFGGTSELLETCAVWVGYSQIDQAIRVLDDVIERDDNRTDPRIVARKNDVLARFRPDELDEFVTTSKARWASNPTLLAALGQSHSIPTPAAPATLHDRPEDLGEIDMGLTPLPGETRLDSIEFTLDLNDTRS
ncbi:LysM peptidoglycan-binding domain-containing protein [Litorivicinus lipolyticus]|uniref:LysM peptidoglycan-binding domain-containing protein n=1 Tax=Litorivicinus lipolyticus TaxID=418701 RepID=A0A5Q2Q707_9GAMM|nr:LysM peptidoglycan-binding domain-containing protein [Litorivicinus lipolyticus]QGG79658.1 LysM peptidoglycan-binding domain-containing protein [Litorivicinus lipolyticus]